MPQAVAVPAPSVEAVLAPAASMAVGESESASAAAEALTQPVPPGAYDSLERFQHNRKSLRSLCGEPAAVEAMGGSQSASWLASPRSAGAAR